MIRLLLARIIRYLAGFLPKYEYYIDYETGNIKRRKQISKMGSYKWINGKVVKIDDNVTSTMDDYTFMGWNEGRSGSYDADLGFITSKNDYRRKMKAKGFVPKESFLYSRKNVSDRIKANVEKRKQQTAERDYATFRTAVNMAESRHGVRLD